jgi:hypothetical protein
LQWKTETEFNNYGFNVERSINNKEWIILGFIEGNGNSNSPKSYAFTDSNISNSDTYFYRLKQIDNDGTFEYSDVISVEVVFPSVFELSQNYPNPFNPVTNIDFVNHKKQLVIMRIYNSLGQVVTEIVNQQLESGKQSIIFDAAKLPSGTYIYSIITSQKVLTKKMTLLK